MSETTRILRSNQMRGMLKHAAPASLVSRKVIVQPGQRAKQGTIVFQDKPPLLGQDGAEVWFYKRQEARRLHTVVSK